MQKDSPPFVWAAPEEKDILTCTSSCCSFDPCAYHRLIRCRELHHRMCIASSTRLSAPHEPSVARAIGLPI
jgi:hypothetical protein